MRKAQPKPEGSQDQDRVITRQFILLCLTNFVLFLTVYSLLVTLPLYTVAMGAAAGQAGFTTAAVTLTSFLVLPHLGRNVDRLGRTPLMHVGPALLLAEAVALHFVTWFPLLVALGVLCGASLAMWQTGSSTLVADLAPVHRRGQAMGIFGTFTTTAVALSPAISIFVKESWGFPAVFLMTAALAGTTLALSFLVKEPQRRAIAAAKGPLLSPRALLPGLCIFSITLTYGALISFLPAQAPRMGLTNAGYFFTVYSISTLLVRALAGSVSDRVGRVRVIIPALLVVGGATMLVGQSNSAFMLLAVAAIWGFGYGSAHPTIMALAVDRAGQEQRGQAVATFNAGYNLGVGVGSLAMGFIMEATSFPVMAAVAGAAPLVALSVLYVRREPDALPAAVPQTPGVPSP